MGAMDDWDDSHPRVRVLVRCDGEEKMLPVTDPRAKEALEKVKEIKKNPDASDDLKAHAMLSKARSEFSKGKKANREKGRSLCKKILKSYPETPTAKKAQAMLR